MATITLRKGGSVGICGRFAQISTFRDILHSAYGKNQEDHPSPNVLPDDVIPKQQSEYWAPHPETGVFGPPGEEAHGGPSTGGGERLSSSPVSPPAGGSVLEQKAWFRTHGDVDVDKEAK